METKEHSIPTSPKEGAIESAKAWKAIKIRKFVFIEMVLLLSEERSNISCRKAPDQQQFTVSFFPVKLYCLKLFVLISLSR